ncbi:MAG: hypothetical protein INQ03_12235 [Candidatus Heimdallarchaeota archaeon]|nr:hypothetical protein [Candidatus Heimdallarchaeota archaeon]
MMRKVFILLIILVLSSIQIPLMVTAALPDIDGKLDPIWDEAKQYDIEMTNGQILDLRIIYTETDIYFLAILDHSSSEDEIIRNTEGRHDYFGIEFDLNNDGVIMGTPDSPDDMIIIDYERPGLSDMYSHSYTAYDDNSTGGENNGDGASGELNGKLIWEFRKPLNSGDTAGYDISLQEGDEYYIMLAFWDDKYPHNSATYTNTFKDNNQFIRFFVGDLDPALIPEFAVSIFVITSIALALIITRKK